MLFDGQNKKKGNNSLGIIRIYMLAMRVVVALRPYGIAL